MSEVTYVAWEPIQETDLTAIEAIRSDIFGAFLIAKDLQDILLAQRNGGDQQIRLVEPLMIAALVKYFRPFKSGRNPRRLHISVIEDMPSDLKAAHERFLKVRDWHVVHPVNQFEVHNVMLAVADIGKPEARATAVSASTGSIFSMSLDDVGKLIDLCKRWMDWLTDEAKGAQEALLAEASLLSAEQLNTLPSCMKQPSADPRLQRPTKGECGIAKPGAERRRR